MNAEKAMLNYAYIVFAFLEDKKDERRGEMMNEEEKFERRGKTRKIKREIMKEEKT